ncbi:MAG: hypothetical protein AB3N20_15405 [Rhizobiaceae bacterium]
MRHVLFGGPLLLHDGYLIQNKHCLAALKGNADNGLRYLIDTGYVNLLTSNDGPVSSLEKRADKVPSIAAVIRSGEWPEIRQTLKEIERGLERRNLLKLFPKLNFSESIIRGIRQISSKKDVREFGLENEFRDAYFRTNDAFVEELEKDHDAPRSKWEAATEKLKNDGVISIAAKNRLMNIANEVYHYRFASCLAAESDKPVAVETAVSPAFDEILDTAELSHEQLASLPSFQLPTSLSFANTRKIHEVLYPGHELYDAKTAYLNDLYLYGSRRIGLDHFESSAKRYARLVSSHFGRSIEISATMDTGLSLFVFGISERLKQLGVPEQIASRIGIESGAFTGLVDYLKENNLESALDTISGGVGIIGEKIALPMLTKRIISKRIELGMYRKIENEDWRRKIAANLSATKFASVVIDQQKAQEANRGIGTYA